MSISFSTLVGWGLKFPRLLSNLMTRAKMKAHCRFCWQE